MANGGDLTPILETIQKIVESGEEVEPNTAIKLMLPILVAIYNRSGTNGKDILSIKRVLYIVGAVALLSSAIIGAHVKSPDLLNTLLGVP